MFNRYDLVNELLTTYFKMADSNPHTLRSLIPPFEIWRFFIDGKNQKSGRGLRIGCDEEFMDLPISSLEKTTPTLRPYLNKNNYTLSTEEASHYTPRQLLAIDKGWLPYEFNEPGYLPAMHNAFNEIFDIFAILDASFIKKLHQLATNNVNNMNYDMTKEAKKGTFRTPDFAGSFYLYKGNCSKKGIAELLKKNSDSLAIVFTIKDDNKILINPYLINELRSHPPKHSLSYYTTPSFSSSNMTEKFPEFYNSSPERQQFIDALSETKDDQEAATILYNYIASSKDSPQFVSIEADDETASTEMDKLLLQYYLSMNEAKNDPIERLKAIILFIQSCEQLHPFADGNCRTFCMLLLNHLLLKNGFPPAILEDPNRFDLFSQSELLNEVINGMRNTCLLIKNKKIYNVSTQKILNYISSSPFKHIKNLHSHFQACVTMETHHRQLQEKMNLTQKNTNKSSPLIHFFNRLFTKKPAKNDRSLTQSVTRKPHK